MAMVKKKFIGAALLLAFHSPFNAAVADPGIPYEKGAETPASECESKTLNSFPGCKAGGININSYRSKVLTVCDGADKYRAEHREATGKIKALETELMKAEFNQFTSRDVTIAAEKAAATAKITHANFLRFYQSAAGEYKQVIESIKSTHENHLQALKKAYGDDQKLWTEDQNANARRVMVSVQKNLSDCKSEVEKLAAFQRSIGAFVSNLKEIKLPPVRNSR